MSETVLCPRCQSRHYTPYGGGPAAAEAPRPAMSRAAEVYICSWCGTHEALMDFAGAELPKPDEWPLLPDEVRAAEEELPA